MFSGLSRRRVILLVVLTCVLLITLDKRGNPVLDQLRSGFARVVSPVDTATRAVVLPIERAWNGIVGYDDLARENEALRDQLERIKGNDVEAQSAVLEYRGMPVTDGAGLIGRITQVFPNRSIVLLLTDPEYAISAQVLGAADQPVDGGNQTTQSTLLTGQSVSDLTSSTTTTSTTVVLPEGLEPLPGGGGATGTGTDTGSGTSTSAPATSTTLAPVIRETGTLQGQGADKPLVLRFVDTTSSLTAVKVGAVVDTAGGNNSNAPQGIPIGVISRITKQTGTSSALIEVTPNASLKRLNFVAVVLYVSNADVVGK